LLVVVISWVAHNTPVSDTLSKHALISTLSGIIFYTQDLLKVLLFINKSKICFQFFVLGFQFGVTKQRDTM